MKYKRNAPIKCLTFFYVYLKFSLHLQSLDNLISLMVELTNRGKNFQSSLQSLSPSLILKLAKQKTRVLMEDPILEFTWGKSTKMMKGMKLGSKNFIPFHLISKKLNKNWILCGLRGFLYGDGREREREKEILARSWGVHEEIEWTKGDLQHEARSNVRFHVLALGRAFQVLHLSCFL